MAAAAGEANSVSRTVPLSSPNEFARRPTFVSKDKLAKLYSCGLCEEILVQPQQAPCGNRVCKECIDKVFVDKEVVPCPFSHDEDDDEEPCQQEGLRRSGVTEDRAVHRRLLREECFCPHRSYGCATTIPWKRLTAHIQSCKFTPEPCQNTGCPKKVSILSKLSHQEECLYVITSCYLCKETMARKDLKDHLEQCERSCKTCPKVFDCANQLLLHQGTHMPCLTEAWNGFHYIFYKLAQTDVEQLKDEKYISKFLHMLEEKIEKGLKRKIKSVVDASKDNAIKIRKLEDGQQSSERVATKVAAIERCIKESGLDKANAFESHSRQIRINSDRLDDVDNHIKDPEYVSYNGTLLWRIKDYKRSKMNAIRRSIDSNIFYSSGNGYKMRCQAYLNGNGSGRGNYLSLYLLVMRGQFDELLQFPFKQKVTFTLISQSNNCIHKITKTFEPNRPDGTGPYPPNQSTAINIFPGCPQFALQSQVESSDFLNADSIFIKVVVAPGGDELTK